MICVTVNFRAYSELSSESEQNDVLNNKIESLTTENLSLQEEIHYLKNDSDVIEREARKFGLQRREEKVLVPAK